MWKNNGKRKPKNGTYCRAGYKCVPKEMGVGQGGGKEERTNCVVCLSYRGQLKTKEIKE